MSRFLYTLLLSFASPYIIWRFGKRHHWRAASWLAYGGFYQTAANDNAPPLIWIHTVSLGEAIAATQLSKQIETAGYRLLLTYTTIAGCRYLQKTHPAAVITVLPVDFSSCVRRFLRHYRPALGIIVEAEYWPNLLLETRKSGIPLMLANARLSAKSARRFRFAAGLFRRCIGSFDGITAQTAADAGRLRCFGGRRITTAGNLKFDHADEAVIVPPSPLSDKPVLLFAAVRGGEDTLLLNAMDEQLWRQFFIILAPRKPEEQSAAINALLKQRKIVYAVHSRGQTPTADTQLLLADTLGEMARWYAACDIAVIGGSFLPFGGQNPIEAMQRGVAAIIGPHVDNYRRLVRRAVAAGALMQSADAAAALRLAQDVAQDNNDAQHHAALRFCANERGALQKNKTLALALLQHNNAPFIQTQQQPAYGRTDAPTDAESHPEHKSDNAATTTR